MKKIKWALIWMPLLLLSTMDAFAIQQEESKTNIIIKTNEIQGKTAKEIFSLLTNIYQINIAFQDGDSVFYQPLNFPKRKTIELDELLKVMQNNLPYLINYKKGYIILKKKDLQKKYKLEGKLFDTEDNKSLPAASVLVKQTSTGSLSDENGVFLLELKPGTYDIVIKYLGYNDVSKRINLYDNQYFSIGLDQNNFSIGEVDVTSERTFKSDFKVGRTIEKIDSKEIGAITSNNVLDALHARMPGVWATKVSGAPGDHMKIRIRGINSLNASVDPLYVVDGVMIPKVNLHSLGISDLNSSDIESLIILKDAASNAIYGFQGGNGVVIIETKKPGGKPTITFEQKTGIQTFNHKRYDLNNTYDYLQTYGIVDSYNTERSVFFNERYLSHPFYRRSLVDKDWQDEIFDNGFMTEYQLNTSGGIKDFKYYVSGALSDIDGILANSNYNKKNVLAHLCYDIRTKGSVKVNYRGALEENNNNLDTYLGNPVIFQGVNTPPYLGSRGAIVDIAPLERKVLFPDEGIYLPGGVPSLLNLYDRNQDISSNSIILSGNYNLTQHLLIDASASYLSKNYSYTYSHHHNDIDDMAGFIRLGYDDLYGELHSTDEVKVLNYHSNLSYNNQFGSHKIKLLGGYRHYTDNIYWKILSTDYDNYELKENLDIYPRGSSIILGPEGATTRKLRTGYFHANYNYLEKYTLSLAGCYSSLGEGDKNLAAHFFPSAAINWDLAQEKYIKEIKQLDYLNAYVNWGKVGNYPLNSLSENIYATQSYADNTGTKDEPFINNLGNHKLSHEVLSEINVGTEISLFKQRVILGFDYYQRKNTNLILLREIPLYYGGGKMMFNSGEMNSTGIELSLDVIPIETKNFQWQIRANYSQNNQSISKLDTALYFFNEADYIPDFVISEDEPLGSILGYEFVDFYDSQNESHQNMIDEGSVYLSNDVLYARNDTSSVSILDEKKKVIGNSLPDFTMNLMNRFKYKNLQLEMHWYGVFGLDKYNATKASTFMTGSSSELHERLVSEKPSSVNYFRSSEFYNSDYFIEDASFIRLKRISLSYSPVKKVFKKVSTSFTFSVENLLTFTNYSGYDPEATVYTDNNFSDNALDKGAYPLPKTFHLAVKLKL